MINTRRFQDPVHQEWADRLGFPLDRLLEVGEDLPPATRRHILALGREAIPTLLAILTADDLTDAGAPGEGHAPAHAAVLLADLGAVDAIEPMIERLLNAPEEANVQWAVVQALPQLGPAVLEPALRALEVARNQEAGDRERDIVTVLGRLGVRDQRVFNLLIEQFHDAFARDAWPLAGYGDPRAVPHLARALSQIRLDTSDPYDLALDEAIDMAGAIRDLGGTLTPHQQRTFERALEMRRLLALEEAEGAYAFEAEDEIDFDDVEADDEFALPFDDGVADGQVVSRHDRKVGAAPPKPNSSGSRPTRNQPCWCGSGKKYKNCHLQSDEEGQ